MSWFDNWAKTIRVACDSIAQDEAKPYKVLRCEICNKFVSEYEYYLPGYLPAVMLAVTLLTLPSITDTISLSRFAT